MSDPQEELVNKAIEFIYSDCMPACGDGDALWYSTWFKVKDILPLVEDYNSKLKYPLDINVKDGTIYWQREQECIIITNNESMYLNAPSWSQLTLKW